LHKAQIEDTTCISSRVDPTSWTEPQDFTKWLASLELLPDGFPNLLFIDNLFKFFDEGFLIQWDKFLENLTDVLDSLPICIGFLDVSQYYFLKRAKVPSLKFFAEPPIHFSPLPLNSINDIFEQRLVLLEDQVDLLPIPRPARKRIMSYSLGVPHLAFKLAAQCEEVAYNFDYKKITVELVKEIASYQGFELAHSLLLTNSSTHSDYLHPSLEKNAENLKITPKRKYFLQEFLLFSLEKMSDMTSSSFAEHFGKNLPSVLYHFKDLTKYHILISERSKEDARKVHYKLQEPIATALEILWMEEAKQDLLTLSS
ncbi:MAG: hypothetical protein ACFFBD_19990, partial [Candidatus Hodarchaeota archaeon]